MNTYARMAQSMSGSGRTTSRKEKGSKHDQIMRRTPVNMFRAKNKATGGSISQTIQYMRGSFLIMKSMGRVCISGVMDGNIRGIGKII